MNAFLEILQIRNETVDCLHRKHCLQIESQKTHASFALNVRYFADLEIKYFVLNLLHTLFILSE